MTTYQRKIERAGQERERENVSTTFLEREHSSTTHHERENSSGKNIMRERALIDNTS